MTDKQPPNQGDAENLDGIVEELKKVLTGLGKADVSSSAPPSGPSTPLPSLPPLVSTPEEAPGPLTPPPAGPDEWNTLPPLDDFSAPTEAPLGSHHWPEEPLTFPDATLPSDSPFASLDAPPDFPPMAFDEKPLGEEPRRESKTAEPLLPPPPPSSPSLSFLDEGLGEIHASMVPPHTEFFDADVPLPSVVSPSDPARKEPMDLPPPPSAPDVSSAVPSLMMPDVSSVELKPAFHDELAPAPQLAPVAEKTELPLPPVGFPPEPIKEELAMKPTGLVQIACIFPEGQSTPAQQFVMRLRTMGSQWRQPLDVQTVFVHPWRLDALEVAAWRKSSDLSGADMMLILAYDKDRALFHGIAHDPLARPTCRVISMEQLAQRTVLADLLADMHRGQPW